MILHTGDMRWHPHMGQHPALRGRRIDLLFMDTTYGLPKHVHPPQVQIITSSLVLPKKQTSSWHLAAAVHVWVLRTTKSQHGPMCTLTMQVSNTEDAL